MKKFSLVLAVLLSLAVLSISFVSGVSTGNVGLEISTFILRIITGLFPNNNIVLAELHIVLLNVGHILIYMILGLIWFLTGRLWNLSLMRILLIGLMITSVRELINLLVLNQESNFFETLAMDFLPFLFINLFLFKFNNKEKRVEMKEVLDKVKSGEISSDQAYKEIYQDQRSKMPVTSHAHFLRLRIVVPEEKGVTTFLGIIFFLPIPLGIVRFMFSFVKDEQLEDVPFTKSEILNMISSKGINVNVNTSDKTKVIIKTI